MLNYIRYVLGALRVIQLPYGGDERRRRVSTLACQLDG